MSDPLPAGLAGAFRAWCEPEPDPAPFLSAGLVAVDASALLHLYRVTPASPAQILSTLERLQDRLWIPHQAALEFHRNRAAAVLGRQQRYATTRNALSQATGKAFQEFRKAVGQLIELRAYNMVDREWDPGTHELDDKGLHRKVDGLLAPALAELAAMQGEHDIGPGDIADDPILAQLDRLSRGRLGRPYGQGRLIDLVREAVEFRYPNAIPPGYKDFDAKSAAYLAAGDYILWSQLLDHARTLPGPRRVALITNDIKPDWWVLDRNGEPERPRPELRQEMAERADAEMVLLTLSGFLTAAAARFPGITAEAVDEVRATEEQERTEAVAVDGPPLLIVDGANVVGSVPDGWWQDRAGAAIRLRDRLAGIAETGIPDRPGPLEVVLVVEGKARDIPAVDGVRLVRAAGTGDDAVVQVVADNAPGREVVVVTADRALRHRVLTLGARVIGPSSIPR